jgi:hypothetical protein
MGLLSRALALATFKSFSGTLTESPGIDFFEIAEESCMGQCAVITQVDGSYHIKQNHGFTAETIVRSVSSADFWNGVFAQETENGWIIKKGEDISPFSHLFSESDREGLESLMLRRVTRTDGSDIIWIGNGGASSIKAADALLEKIVASGIDFPAADSIPHEDPPDGLSANLFEIDFSDVVESVPQHDANYSLELLLSLSRTIFYGAYHLCGTVFASPNRCAVSRDSCIRAVIFSACEIDAYVLNTQLSQALSPYFSADALEALQVYGIGLESSPPSIFAFLQTSD